ncbi:CPBP family intramembrane glutamic endopeptidase [Haloarcula sp. H-GB4]|uniref:CPBP family intramembrane glutamic endopeptidase n=1 Tax=Haloarcula sp. H-GB4 TaxID=3069755 RepID=UPI0027B1288D|nr:CPBP family intramembrane glutamic endopeptidase [Haloarcula sp. H-GB4]MDQ2074746.1 CPBP family intramembrane glutamic endopeptidase [Haloarcula sp. H-GB4]
MSENISVSSGITDLIHRLLYGSEDTRLRATWRVVIPVFAALVTYLGGRIVMRIAFQSVIGNVSRTSVVLQTLTPLILTATLMIASGLVALAVASRLDNRPLTSYGFAWSTQWVVDFLVGTIIGVSALICTVLYQVARGYATLRTDLTGVGVDSIPLGVLVVVALLVFSLSNNVFEEIVFRTIFIQNAAEGLVKRSVGKRTAVMLALVASTPIFGIWHLLGGGLSAVLTSLVGGFLFGTAYILSGQLSLPIGVHFGGVALLILTQQPFSQNPELTLPSLFVVEIANISLAQSIEIWVVRAAVGIVLICAWVYYSAGEIAIAEEVRP